MLVELTSILFPPKSSIVHSTDSYCMYVVDTILCSEDTTMKKPQKCLPS